MPCPACFNAKELRSLLANAELAGTVQPWDWIGDEAATTFSYPDRMPTREWHPTMTSEPVAAGHRTGARMIDHVRRQVPGGSSREPPRSAATCAAPMQGPITQCQEKTDCDGPVRVCVDGLRCQAAPRFC